MSAPALTPESFSKAFRDAVERAQIPLRRLASLAKVPEARVREWVRGESLPTPAEFSRVHFGLPHLRHLKPALVAAHREAALSAVHVAAPEPPSSPPPSPRPRVLPFEEKPGALVALVAAPEPSPAAPAPERLALPPEAYLTAGACLVALRARDGLTQDDLGDLVGVVGSAVWAWETGVAVPVKTHREKLLSIWPELASAPPFPSRGISKPPGRHGCTGAANDAPPDSPNAAAPSSPAPALVPPMPQEAPPMPAPRTPSPAVAASLPVVLAAVRFETALARDAPPETRRALLSLLAAADAGGLSVGDVAAIIEAAGPGTS